MKSALSLVVAALAAGAWGQTLTQRLDFSHGNGPYTTTFLADTSGWELDWFGDNSRDTWDIELCHPVFTTKQVTLEAGAVAWPVTNQYFGLLSAFYNDRLAGGDLYLMLGAYLPVNGGPQILLSDDSALMWAVASDKKLGLGATLLMQGGQSNLRCGPQVEFGRGNTTLRLTYQPFYLTGHGAGVGRIEIVRKL